MPRQRPPHALGTGPVLIPHRPALRQPAPMTCLRPCSEDLRGLRRPELRDPVGRLRLEDMSDHQQQTTPENKTNSTPPPVGSTHPVRVDSWLWSVRLFKTRSAATTACRAGHVTIDGQPVKASARVTPGTTITLRRPGHELILEVVRTLSARVGAPAARQAYRDHSPERIRPRDVGLPVRERGAGRPTKRERRQLDKLRGRQSSPASDLLG